MDVQSYFFTHIVYNFRGLPLPFGYVLSVSVAVSVCLSHILSEYTNLHCLKDSAYFGGRKLLHEKLLLAFY